MSLLHYNIFSHRQLIIYSPRSPLQNLQDKGGDPATFRATQAAWEVVRDQHEKGIGSFASHLGGEGDEEEEDDAELDELYKKYSANTGVPSYEFYEEAAEEEVPGYKVETAKSGRSKCTKCESKIAKDEIRVGSLDKTAGTYGRWHHLQCWRVVSYYFTLMSIVRRRELPIAYVPFPFCSQEKYKMD